MEESSNIHHTFTVNSITTNNFTVHAPSSPPVSMHNNSRVSAEQVQVVSHALSQADDVLTDEQTQQSQPIDSNCVLKFIDNFKKWFINKPDKCKHFSEQNLKKSDSMKGTSSGAKGGTKGWTLEEVAEFFKLFVNPDLPSEIF